MSKMIKQAKKPHYLHSVRQVPRLSEKEKNALREIEQLYRFRANDYYLSLIDWDNPEDPLRKLILPAMHETEVWGHLDPSGEKNYTVIPGLEHKYPSTALLLVSNVCGGICRYCFRKRVFIRKHGDLLKDLPAALQYISEHTEITNVLLTGGDPLMLATSKLRRIIEPLKKIHHVRIIRIGSKMPAFDPYRIINDPELLTLFENLCTRDKQLYVMTHFNHSQELTNVAVDAVDAIRHAGANLANQTPIIRGVNDHPEVLANLFRNLSFIGVPPYYIFQCRPASGNKGYAVPIEEGYHIHEQAKSMVSGLAKRARYVISHLTGKIEVVGIKNERVFMKYHRAENDRDNNRFMEFPSNPQAYWFDDYVPEEPGGSSLDIAYKTHGPE